MWTYTHPNNTHIQKSIFREESSPENDVFERRFLNGIDLHPELPLPKAHPLYTIQVHVLDGWSVCCFWKPHPWDPTSLNQGTVAIYSGLILSSAAQKG